MRVAVTGADGFVGRNLVIRLTELGHDILPVTRETAAASLASTLASAEFVFHLAGVNRPETADGFGENADLADALCTALGARSIPIVYTSSTQAALDNPYGASKRQAEDTLLAHGLRAGSPIHIFRLTNVFGKWSRPNYNSAVATFCHNIAHGLPIRIDNPDAPLRLVYIDDVVSAFVRLLEKPVTGSGFKEIEPVYETTVGRIAAVIEEFRSSRSSLITPPVGNGLTRALHATYLSFLPSESFGYDVTVHADQRGVFVEMLKTADSGQFSYFTARPGVTRGGHYHHSKSEKFLVVMGTARFGFRNVATGETTHCVVEGGAGRIVETVPGWSHDITNVGDGELVCMLWANEVFDPENPDTIAAKVL